MIGILKFVLINFLGFIFLRTLLRILILGAIAIGGIAMLRKIIDPLG